MNQYPCLRVLWIPLSLILPAFTLTAVSAAPLGPVKVEPARVFDVHDSLPSTHGGKFLVHEFVARPQGLYYMLSPGVGAGGAGTIILHTDDRGGFQASITPAPGNVRAFDVDDRGNVFVLRGRARGDRGVRRYDPRGNPLEMYPVARGVRTFCVVDGVPLVAGYDGFLYALATDKDRMIGQVGSGPGMLMSTLSRGRFVLLNRAVGSISVGTANGGVERNFVPSAPEIVVTPRPGPATDGSGQAHVLVYSWVATSREGEIYVGVTGHKIAEGAVVLRLSDRGEVLESLRLRLPRFPELEEPGNLDGYMFPSHIGIMDESMIIVDGASGKVAVYAR